MKKLHLFSMVCLLTLLVISLASCGKEEYDTNPRGNGNSDGEYVDLGLPSGTKWKTSNETKEDGCEFYTYEEAERAFGNKVPAKWQYEELMQYCLWEWQSDVGYKVSSYDRTSYIILPAAGSRSDEGHEFGHGEVGLYWSSTNYEIPDEAWRLKFLQSWKGMNHEDYCWGFSIRLVKNE